MPIDFLLPFGWVSKISLEPSIEKSIRDPSSLTVASSPALRAQRSTLSCAGTKIPCLVIPIGMTSYLFLSIAPRTPAAVAQEIECSLDFPPKRITTLVFFITHPTGHLFRELGEEQYLLDSFFPQAPTEPVQQLAFERP
ncbi:unannotated protein [freshwater metagenome]|uniref:Unannotated protein n=1 Tax=freshwater metagenome TaxID=449393 RepID=A0A6J6K3F3_9ZZZZ